jgi:hypothetical protein
MAIRGYDPALPFVGQDPEDGRDQVHVPRTDPGCGEGRRLETALELDREPELARDGRV